MDLQTTLDVEGMSCGGCADHISKALGALPGVRAIDVELDAGKVVVRHDAGRAPVAVLLDTLKQAGYDGRVELR